MEILHYFSSSFDKILLHKNDLILFSVAISIILFLRILIGLLKKRIGLSNLVTKTINYFIILIFLEFIKDKVEGLWFLKILFFFETIFVFLVVKVVVIDLYIKEYLIDRKNKKISHIIVDITKLIIGILFIMVFLRNVFNVNLVAILTPSAILTAIVGLSMKDTIGNLMSGIVIQIEKPFDIGDWIQVGDLIGRVQEINWRYTKIRTILNIYIIIPNNTISSDNIINYSKPTKEIEVELDIGVSYEVPPVKVKRAIYEILEKNQYVLKNRRKRVLLMDYGASSINYKIVFGVDNYYVKRFVVDEIYTSIWYQFKNYGIEIPFPIRTVIMRKPEEQKPNKYVIEALKKNDLFKDAREDVLEFLATYGNLIKFQRGDEVIREGEMGDTMYIIIEGEYEVMRGGKSIALISKGDFFGEVALISDKKRNASVICKSEGCVLELDRMLFKLVLERDKVLRDVVYEKFQERVIKELKGDEKVDKHEKMTLFKNLKRLCGLS